MENKLYTIGEFANLADVKRQTLLWYDEIGLFKPYQISDNGYRYYSLDQLETFSVIRSLKDLGIPLDRIKDIINNRTPAEMAVIFQDQITEINNNITKLERLKQSLSSWNHMINRLNTLPLDTVFIEYQEAEQLLVTQKISNVPSETRSIEITKLNEYRSKSSQIAENLGGIISKENFLQDQTIYDYFYLPAFESDHNYIKEAGYFVSVYYKGDYTQTYKIYSKIRHFATENNLNLGGRTYEQSQIGELAASNAAEYITKVSIPIVANPH